VYALLATSFVICHGFVSSARLHTSFADSLNDFGTKVFIQLTNVFPIKSLAAPSNCPAFLNVFLSHIGIVALF
jgi:hypothetical protein